MRGTDTNLGNEVCPWKSAAAANEQPFFDGPMRWGALANMPRLFLACGYPVDISQSARLQHRARARR